MGSEKKFYFDLTLEGKRAPVKTVAGFWPLIAGVPTRGQAEPLVAQLNNPKTFARFIASPPRPPTSRATIRWAVLVRRRLGADRYDGHPRPGMLRLRRSGPRNRDNHLTNIGRVFEKTGTVWENYAPDRCEPGNLAAPLRRLDRHRPDPLSLNSPSALKPDAPNNRLTWALESAKRCGCQRYRFNGHTATLTAEPPAEASAAWRIVVESDGAFDLSVKRGGRQWDFSVKKGATHSPSIGELSAGVWTH